MSTLGVVAPNRMPRFPSLPATLAVVAMLLVVAMNAGPLLFGE